MREAERQKERDKLQRIENSRKNIVYRQSYSTSNLNPIRRMKSYNAKLEQQFRSGLLTHLKRLSKKKEGTISTEELASGFQVLGHGVSPTELNTIISTCKFQERSRIRAERRVKTYGRRLKQKPTMLDDKTLAVKDLQATLEVPESLRNNFGKLWADREAAMNKRTAPFDMRRNHMMEKYVKLSNDNINKFLTGNLLPTENSNAGTSNNNAEDRESEEKVEKKDLNCDFDSAFQFNTVQSGDQSASVKAQDAIEHKKKIRSMKEEIIRKTRDAFKQKFFVEGTAGALLDLFRKYDIDGSGALSKFEFAQVLKYLKIELSRDELDALMSAFDDDGSGEIEYKEFARAMAKAPKLSSGTKLHKYGMQLIFGEATYARETNRLKKLQRDQAREMFRPIDMEHAALALQLSVKTRGLDAQTLVNFFLKHDSDGSGDLDAEEFKHALNIDLKLGLSEQHLEALVTLLDRNNDGEISYNELSEMLTPFTKKHPIKPNLSKSDIDSHPYLRQRTWYGPKFHSIIKLSKTGESHRSYGYLPNLTCKRPPEKRRENHEKMRDTIHSKAIKSVPPQQFFSGFLGTKSLRDKSAQTLRMKETTRKQHAANMQRKHVSSAPILGLESIGDEYRELVRSRPNTSMGGIQ